MAINITNSKFNMCKGVISAPSDISIDINMDSNSFNLCGSVVHLRAPESLSGALGLKPDTPKDILLDVLSFISTSQKPAQEIEEKVRSAGLLEWLSAGANVTTLVQGLGELYPRAAKIIENWSQAQ